MPCGGIYPVTLPKEIRCWHCGKLDTDHYCAEWDTGIHGACIEEFLKTPEGEIVLSHKHAVVRKTGDTIEVLYEEGSNEPKQKG